MSQTKKTALVVGANGIIGRNLARYLTSRSDWNVLVTSRTELHYDTKADFVEMDLSDADAVSSNREVLKGVTHIFYAAYVEKSNPFDAADTNLMLLENLISGIEQVATNFQHVTFIQGGKAYGAHLGIYKAPAYETDLRSIKPNFYYSQEDFLRKASEHKKWNWTAIRPDIVIGFTIGNPMNLSNLIGVYATLCKELDIPMRFPGSQKAYDALINVTGVDVLSRAMEWAGTAENAQNEIFNITDGDIFRWSQAWKQFGEFFEVEIAEPQTFSLQKYMAGQGKIWDQIVKRYQLKPYKLDKLVQWSFGDFIFNVEHDAFMDVNKARRFGFQEMNGNSISMMLSAFQQLKNENIIPA